MRTTLKLIGHSAMHASDDDDVRVIKVPRALVKEMWPRVVPHLERGCAALPNVTVEEIKSGVEAGSDDLWVVFVNHDLVASFVTAQFKDDRPFLGLYALGGRKMREWVGRMDEVVTYETERLGLPRFLFAGRRAWGRVVPDIKEVGTMGEHVIFERAVT